VRNPCPQRFTFFTHRFQPLGGAVAGTGVVVGEDLGSPPSQRVAERDDLGDLGLGAAGDGLVQQQRRVGRVFGQIHISHRLRLVGQPRPEYLVGGFADP
jgi:hypothetical protein